MATNVFTKAKAYRKQHPRTSYQDAIQIVSKKHKPGKKKKAVGKAVSKTTTKVKRKGNKVIKKTRTVNYIQGIAGISLKKIKDEHAHRQGLEKALDHHRVLLTTKGIPNSEKNRIRREIKHYRNAITASNQHISKLKKSV